jgi:hypothetical protein
LGGVVATDANSRSDIGGCTVSISRLNWPGQTGAIEYELMEVLMAWPIAAGDRAGGDFGD